MHFWLIAIPFLCIGLGGGYIAYPLLNTNGQLRETERLYVGALKELEEARKKPAQCERETASKIETGSVPASKIPRDVQLATLAKERDAAVEKNRTCEIAERMLKDQIETRIQQIDKLTKKLQFRHDEEVIQEIIETRCPRADPRPRPDAVKVQSDLASCQRRLERCRIDRGF